MFAYVVLLILLLPVMFIASTVESLFSADELTEMGIHLENAHSTESPLRSVAGG